MNYNLQKPTLMNIIVELVNEQSAVGLGQNNIAQTNLDDTNKAQELEKEKEDKFNSKYMMVQIPPTTFMNGKLLALPVGSKISVWPDVVQPSDYSKDYDSWKGTEWEPFIPTSEELTRIFPGGTLRSFATPTGSRYHATLKRVSNPPNLKHEFYWYFDQDNQPYKQNFDPNEIPKSMTPEEETWWDKWGVIILNVAASVAAAWLTGGASLLVQISVQIGIDLAFAGIQLAQGDKFGASISAILAFIPLASKFLKIGEVSSKVVANIAKKVASCKDVEALKAVYAGFSQAERVTFRKIFSNQSEELVKATSQGLYNQIKEAIANKTFTMAKVPVMQRKALKEFFFSLVVSAGVIGGGIEYERREAERMYNEAMAQMVHDVVPPKDEQKNLLDEFLKDEGINLNDLK